MFAPEYADVYGVPFQFIPTVGKTRELTLKPTRHVRAEPDRASLAITFPRLVGYRLEMPAEPLSADLSRDDVRMVLTKAAVPTETVMAGIVGFEETHTLDDLRKRREQEIVYALAADILERKLCIDSQPRPWYFPQLVPIVREWMTRCVTYHDDAFPGMLLLRDHEATDKIWLAITNKQGKRSSFVFPVLRPLHPVGTTAGVDFHTTKAVYPTAEDRCHINFVTLDGDGGNAWERAVAQALEGLPRIAAYAKNDRLDFVIPYEHLGRSRRYVPDFLARLVDSGDGIRRTLVIEVSGTRKDPSQTTTKAATARQMWVPAVNNHGGWGLWAYCEIRDPTRAKLDINAAIDELSNYRPPNVLADVSL
jgi:type III restriction enzyme